MLELNPDAARVVGAKIAADRMVFVVTDFCGDVLSELALPIRIDRQPVGVIADLIEDGVRRCVWMPGSARRGAAGLPRLARRDRAPHRHLVRARSSASADGLRRRSDGTARYPDHCRERCPCDHARPPLVRAGTRSRGLVLVSLEHTLGLGVLHGNSSFAAPAASATISAIWCSAAGPQRRAIRLADQAGETAILDGRVARGRSCRCGQLRARHEPRPCSDRRRTADCTRRRCGRRTRSGSRIANVVTLFAPPRVIVVGSSLSLGELFLGRLRESYARGDPALLAGGDRAGVRSPADVFWAQGAAALALHELYEMRRRRHQGRRAQANHGGADGKGRNRHYRLRQHLGRLSEGDARLSRSSTSAASPT